MITLNLTKDQLSIVESSLDLYSRISLGQFEYITDYPTLIRQHWNQIMDKDGKIDFVQYDKIHKEARNIIIQKNLNLDSTWVISDKNIDESCRIAHDIIQLIQQKSQSKDSIEFECLEYQEVISKTGRTWLDRNLGAESLPKSPDDEESFGIYYHFDDIKFPTGYRLPTEEEWKEEIETWETQDLFGAFSSVLKLPSQGFLSSRSKAAFGIGSYGYYWSSSSSNENVCRLYFHDKYAGTASIDYRSFVLPVRLIKDIEL